MMFRIGRKPKVKGSQPVGDSEGGEIERKAKKPSKLQKRNAHPRSEDRQRGINELGEYDFPMWSETSTLVEDKPRDYTDMLHGLAHRNSFETLAEAQPHNLGRDNEAPDEAEARRLLMLSEQRKRTMQKLPSNVYNLIISFLDPADAAHLAVASKVFLGKLGNRPFRELARPENQLFRIRFLNNMDRHLPNHLLCFPCGTYHRRINIGSEKFKADFVNNPLYLCPKVNTSYLPRMRIVHGRELPYSFIQLATRYAILSKSHGIHTDNLSRRWTDHNSGWTHQSRYIIHDGHLLMRIRSQIFAPPNLPPTGTRMLLYERDEYQPFFSVCAHWRDGDLMPIAKCALSHVPTTPESLARRLQTPQGLFAQPSFVASTCNECRPARRCPECPTEYLIEITMIEDKKDPANRFKYALVVTRWSDLGDGSSPTASPEYCAINGIKPDYDSFSSVGRRSIGGIFESKINGCIPGQRMISLNPGNKKRGEDGHGWY